MGIVDREQVEKIIIDVEQVFKKYDLMPDEKMIAINEIVGRINKTREELRMKDLMSNNVGGGLLRSLQKKFFNSEEEEKNEKETKFIYGWGY